MGKTLKLADTFSWIFALLLIVIGILNLFLVHPVPGLTYFFLSLFYYPPVNVLLKERLGFSVPPLLKIGLGILIMMFTLGVSDLGDIIDDLALNHQC